MASRADILVNAFGNSGVHGDHCDRCSSLQLVSDGLMLRCDAGREGELIFRSVSHQSQTLGVSHVAFASVNLSMPFLQADSGLVEAGEDAI